MKIIQKNLTGKTENGKKYRVKQIIRGRVLTLFIQEYSPICDVWFMNSSTVVCESFDKNIQSHGEALIKAYKRLEERSGITLLRRKDKPLLKTA